jgi:hypothetical protein
MQTNVKGEYIVAVSGVRGQHMVVVSGVRGEDFECDLGITQ